MSEKTMSRRAFTAAAAAASMFGIMGGAKIPVASIAYADYDGDTDIAGNLVAETQAAEIEAAKAENRRLDPLKFVTPMSIDELDALLEDEAEVTEDYVTPNGKVIPAVYVRLRNHINRFSAGLGSIVSGDDHWDLYMDFLSEEDAEHILAIPVTKNITAVDYAEILGIPEDEATAILDDLADRSWLWRMRRSGQGVYQVMSAIPGFWEWHELWEGVYGTQESMLQFNQDVDATWGEDRPTCSMYEPLVHVQACDNSVVEGEVPAYCDWEASLDRFEHFGVMPCQCRTKKINYGQLTEEECGRMETCVSMGEIAQFFTEMGVARELTREEAREIIRQNVDDGNTIEGFAFKNGGAYCACNIKVCLFANAYRAMGPTVNSLPYLSDMRLAYDTEACIKCGACMERCPMGVIEPDEDGFMQPNEMCFNCGQCATVCPVQARKLVPKEKWETFERAEDVLDKGLTCARMHMALGGIVDFTGDVEEIRAKDTFRML